MQKNNSVEKFKEWLRSSALTVDSKNDIIHDQDRYFNNSLSSYYSLHYCTSVVLVKQTMQVGFCLFSKQRMCTELKSLIQYAKYLK